MSRDDMVNLLKSKSEGQYGDQLIYCNFYFTKFYLDYYESYLYFLTKVMIKKESVRSDMKFVPLPLKYTKI